MKQPDLFLNDVKEALFIALQNLDHELCPPDQVQFVNYHVGELLKRLTIEDVNFE